MATVTLPHTAKANTDANLFSEVKANDQAIIDQVNGNLDATNIAADSIGTSEIASNIITQSEVSTSFITSGTYAPTLTNVTNISASTCPSDLMYIRIGSMVHVGGRVTIDATAGGGIELGISLPIATNLTALGELGGAAGQTDTSEAFGIAGDAANNRAKLHGVTVSTANNSYYFTFIYRIL
jgi:hypothetical protein